MNGLNVVILTAGKGSRMKSDLPKILHKVAGLSLFEHVLNSVERVRVDKNMIVITSDDILSNYGDILPKQDLHYVVQKKRLGNYIITKILIFFNAIHSAALCQSLVF